MHQDALYQTTTLMPGPKWIEGAQLNPLVVPLDEPLVLFEDCRLCGVTG